MTRKPKCPTRVTKNYDRRWDNKLDLLALWFRKADKNDLRCKDVDRALAMFYSRGTVDDYDLSKRVNRLFGAWGPGGVTDHRMNAVPVDKA